MTAELSALLAGWRRTRHPDVADAIDRASALHESDAARALRTAPPALKDWLAFAETAPVEDRGALAATLGHGTAKHVKAKVVATADWGDDPRVATALNAMCERIPWVSTGSRPTWTQIFKRLKALRDPRTHALAAAFDPTTLGSNWQGPGEYFSGQFGRLADACAVSVVVEPDAELQAAIDAVPSEDTTTTADPLEEVWANPTDDAVRLVIADRLQERGDPRGELIGLQHLVQQDSDPKAVRKAKSRIKKLCKAHRDHLLGPLASILKVTTVEYRLGFLHACASKDVVHRHQLADVLKSPLARTIHTLTAPPHVLARPEFVGLRDARMPSYPFEAPELLSIDRTTAIEALTLPISTPEDRDALAATTAFPALAHLTVSQAEAQDRVAIARTPLAQQVRALTFESRQAQLVLDDLPLVRSTSGVDTLRVVYTEEYSRWSADLTLSDAGARFVVGVPNSTWEVERFWAWMKASVATLRSWGPVELHVAEGSDDDRARVAAL